MHKRFSRVSISILFLLSLLLHADVSFSLFIRNHKFKYPTGHWFLFVCCWGTSCRADNSAGHRNHARSFRQQQRYKICNKFSMLKPLNTVLTSLCFCLSRLKHNPGVFKFKRGDHHFFFSVLGALKCWIWKMLENLDFIKVMELISFYSH